jgi:hypothetical protein
MEGMMYEVMRLEKAGDDGRAIAQYEDFIEAVEECQKKHRHIPGTHSLEVWDRDLDIRCGFWVRTGWAFAKDYVTEGTIAVVISV